MIDRHRVFEDGEKASLAKILMRVYFGDFKKVDSKLESPHHFYRNEGSCNIILNYNNDVFSYTGNINEKDILSFQTVYENKMARELSVIKYEPEFKFP